MRRGGEMETELYAKNVKWRKSLVAIILLYFRLLISSQQPKTQQT